MTTKVNEKLVSYDYATQTVVEKEVVVKPFNTSGVRPKGRAVLVMPYELKKSVIVLPNGLDERLRTLDNRVIVVEIGPYCWSDEPTPRAVVGEKVMVSKFAGETLVGPADGKLYRVVNDKDIFVGIEEEK